MIYNNVAQTFVKRPVATNIQIYHAIYGHKSGCSPLCCGTNLEKHSCETLCSGLPVYGSLYRLYTKITKELELTEYPGNLI